MKTIAWVWICFVMSAAGCGKTDNVEAKVPNDPKEAALAQLEDLDRQLTHYVFDNGNYPTNDEGLSVLSGDVAKDPWGNSYQYEFDSKTRQLRLWSSGPDGKNGTADDISIEQ